MILGSTGYIGRNLTRRLDPTEEVVINCAGKKDIVWCERHPTEAYQTNAFCAASYALASAVAKRRFIHISSDHAHCTGPQSQTVYAKSKRLGDELVMAENPQASVIISGHIYAPDCPWIVWLDTELKAGRQVVAYTNRICSPTYIQDLADACRDPKPGLTFVLGSGKVNRYDLFYIYAMVFGYNTDLIVRGLETNPLLVGDSSHASDVPTLDIYEGFSRMKREIEDNQ